MKQDIYLIKNKVENYLKNVTEYVKSMYLQQINAVLTRTIVFIFLMQKPKWYRTVGVLREINGRLWRGDVHD